jgi:hypothetical protein
MMKTTFGFSAAIPDAMHPANTAGTIHFPTHFFTILPPRLLNTGIADQSIGNQKSEFKNGSKSCMDHFPERF